MESVADTASKLGQEIIEAFKLLPADDTESIGNLVLKNNLKKLERLYCFRWNLSCLNIWDILSMRFHRK